MNQKPYHDFSRECFKRMYNVLYGFCLIFKQLRTQKTNKWFNNGAYALSVGPICILKRLYNEWVPTFLRNFIELKFPIKHNEM